MRKKGFISNATLLIEAYCKTQTLDTGFDNKEWY